MSTQKRWTLSYLPGAQAVERLSARLPMRLYVKRLSLVTAACMFFLYATGVLVTTTHSGHGCGESWPLCRGKFVPDFAISTAIEYGHRVTSALVTFLVLGLAAGIWAYWRSRLELRILAPVMVVTLFLEIPLGALLALANPSPVILAIHFGTSLILFASIYLAALLLYELDGWDALRDRPAPPRFRALAIGLLALTYLAGYLGAYLRFRGVELACNSWPLCNGAVIPDLGQGRGVVLAHRLTALLLVAGTAALFVWARRLRGVRPDLYRGSLWALVLVLAQAAEGAIIVGTKASSYSDMAHAGLVILLFGTLCYVSLHALPRPANALAETSSTTTAESGAVGAGAAQPAAAGQS